ncbi:MAG: methanogen output domain 1-containing protein [Bryobacteraceae bacterium]
MDANTLRVLPEVQLNRDDFLRVLIRERTGALQDLVGLPEASGYISLVGQSVGHQLNSQYCSAIQLDRLDRSQVAAVLVALKRRIQGDFYIIEESDDKIVLGNRRCPFEDRVLGRPALCMMTSNVFGAIAAQNLGYAKVELQETIARGDRGCRVVVYLKQTREAEEACGREYFRDEHLR